MAEDARKRLREQGRITRGKILIGLIALAVIIFASVMIEKNMPDEEILRSAVAAGTASITTPGTNLFYRDKYEEIYDKIFVEKI